ncbi:MAG: ROK family glucokinase [Actinomycetota bacterium]
MGFTADMPAETRSGSGTGDAPRSDAAEKILRAPAIGIDIGGTKIAGAVVDAEGTIIARSLVATDAGAPNAAVTGAIKIAQELKAGAPSACAVGVGAAGLVDVERGVILGAPNLPYRNVAIRDMLQSRVGLPAFADNDANVAGWGEFRFGVGKGFGDQLMITVGTGVGGGIILNGSVYRGAHSFGGEIGHIIVQRDGRPCKCGSRGCWEQYASGNAIGRFARERIAAGEGADSTILRKAESAEHITGEMVGESAMEGDAFAVSVVEQAGRWLGIGIATFINALDPSIVIVGGGAAAGTKEVLLRPAREAAAEHTTLREMRPAISIVEAVLGADSGVIGAADSARVAAAAHAG